MQGQWNDVLCCGVHLYSVKVSCSFGDLGEQEWGTWPFYNLFPTPHKSTAVKICSTRPTKVSGHQQSSSSLSVSRGRHQHRPAQAETCLEGKGEKGERSGGAPSRKLGCAPRQPPLTRGGEKLQIDFFRLDDGESRLEIDGCLHGARSGARGRMIGSLLLFWFSFCLFVF